MHHFICQLEKEGCQFVLFVCLFVVSLVCVCVRVRVSLITPEDR